MYELQPVMVADPPETHDDQVSISQEQLQPSQARALFVSHSLTTWNARTFEFAVILFTAEAFSDTLLASSLRGLATTIAALLLSSSVGNAIDKSSNRLQPLLASIVINRLSVLAACIAWFVLLNGFRIELGWSGRGIIFAVAIIIGIIERLSGVANMLASERSWVPAMADSTGLYQITTLNSIMRRIDLICKLVAPLIISFIISIYSIRIGVMFVGIMSGMSWILEILTAKYVWNHTARLRASIVHGESDDSSSSPSPSIVSQMITRWKTQKVSISSYFKSEVWIPSFALSMLHLSALSFSATMITFLLNAGIPLLTITIARTLGSVVEISSTFLTPYGIKTLAQIKRHDGQFEQEDAQLLTNESLETPVRREHSAGLIRSGLWGLTLQVSCLIPAVLAIFQLSGSQMPEYMPGLMAARDFFKASSPTITISAFFVFLSLSRLGLWAYDLTTQEITQTRVNAHQRSSFAGTEMAFVSLFEMGQWILAAILSRPEQFRWIALVSLGATCCSIALYAYWVRRNRGHLVHLRHTCIYDKPGR